MMRATAAKAAGWTTIRPLGSRSIPTNAARTTATPSEIVVVQTWARGDDDRALRDARALVSLKHPNLAKIREVVEDGAEVRLVTQFVEGETLAALRRGGPVPLAIELRILVDALTGLSSLHGAKDSKLKPIGFVHSELAPANLVVGLDGVARVIQLAGAHAAPGAQGSDTTSHLAPEILLADDAFDHRVDIYGVGVMLWEALTGAPLFKEKATGAIVTSHLSGRIQKATAPADAPWAAPLIEVAAKAIATDPRARHASATELAAEIKRIAKTNLAPAAKVIALVKERGAAAIEARKTALGSSEPRVSTAARPKIAPAAKPEPVKDEADIGWSIAPPKVDEDKGWTVAPPKVDEAEVGWSLPPPSYEPVSSRDVEPQTSEPPISLESADLEDSAVKSRPQPSAHDRITDPNLIDARALDAAAVTGEATVPVATPAPKIKTMMGLAPVKPAIAPPAMPKPESRDTAAGFAPSADVLAAALSAPPAPKLPAAKPVIGPAPVKAPTPTMMAVAAPVKAPAIAIAAAPAIAPAPAPAIAAAPAVAPAPVIATASAFAPLPAPAPALDPSPAPDPIAAAALVERDKRRKRAAIIFLLCAFLFCVIAIAVRPKSKETEANVPPPGKPTVAATATEKTKPIETAKPAETTPPPVLTATATASVVATAEPPAPTETAQKQADPPPAVTQPTSKPTSTAKAKPKPTYDPLGI